MMHRNQRQFVSKSSTVYPMHIVYEQRDQVPYKEENIDSVLIRRVLNVLSNNSKANAFPLHINSSSFKGSITGLGQCAKQCTYLRMYNAVGTRLRSLRYRSSLVKCHNIKLAYIIRLIGFTCFVNL